MQVKLIKTKKIKCGNLVVDVSDHLPNYFLLFADKPVVRNDRPDVRLFSKKARELFFNKLDTCDWSNIYASTDASSAYNVFSTYIETQFNDCFPKVKLSRKRARDKKMDHQWFEKGQQD